MKVTCGNCHKELQIPQCLPGTMLMCPLCKQWTQVPTTLAGQGFMALGEQKLVPNSNRQPSQSPPTPSQQSDKPISPPTPVRQARPSNKKFKGAALFAALLGACIVVVCIYDFVTLFRPEFLRNKDSVFPSSHTPSSITNSFPSIPPSAKDKVPVTTDKDKTTPPADNGKPPVADKDRAVADKANPAKNEDKPAKTERLPSVTPIPSRPIKPLTLTADYYPFRANTSATYMETSTTNETAYRDWWGFDNEHCYTLFRWYGSMKNGEYVHKGNISVKEARFRRINNGYVEVAEEAAMDPKTMYNKDHDWEPWLKIGAVAGDSWEYTRGNGVRVNPVRLNYCCKAERTQQDVCNPVPRDRPEALL